MKIIHFALSCFYIEGYRYQENILPMLHAKMGHQVMMVASCFSFGTDGKPSEVKPTEYYSKDGFKVIRVPYKKPFNKGALKKVRSYEGVLNILESFKPDIIYFHGCSAFELLNVMKYKCANPRVKVYIDNHADRNNSASSKLSLIVQHKLFYKHILNKILPYTEKILCPSIECMDFCHEIYGVPSEMLEFFPLGGLIMSESERTAYSKKIREAEGIDPHDIVFCHSGKMDKNKRTAQIIEAFSRVRDPSFKLIIIGVLMSDVKEEVLKLIKLDSRIKYLGWKESSELPHYLCASNVYVQPGGQSATMQTAMCSGCAIMVYPFKSHGPYLKDNGYYIKDVDDMERAFLDISENHSKVSSMQNNSLAIACDILDYYKMAERILM